MIKTATTNYYDLEKRTLKFAEDVRRFIKKLPKTISNIEDGKQLNRSSGSVGANYIEANESISKKDFTHRIKICRKEAKESNYRLQLVDTHPEQEDERQKLLKESLELTKIFSAIMFKCEK